VVPSSIRLMFVELPSSEKRPPLGVACHAGHRSFGGVAGRAGAAARYPRGAACMG